MDERKSARTSAPKNLRAEMPQTAAFIDACREAFGAAEINASIRAGINGQPTFSASENGREIGTKSKNEGLSLSQIVVGPLSRTTQAGKAQK
jgi:hypothetical protein